MSSVAAILIFKAKPSKGLEVARLIAEAKPKVLEEPGTPVWLVLRSNTEPDTVYLIDVFTDPAGRDAHMKGAAADLVFATVPPLLEAEPQIHPADLIAFIGL